MANFNITNGGSDTRGDVPNTGSGTKDLYAQGSAEQQQRARRMLENPKPTAGAGQSAVRAERPVTGPAVPLPKE